MLKWLKPTKPPRVWVVKQIDPGILHICGQGIAEGKERPKEKMTALAQGRYQGAVRLANSGIVLNSALFAALVPLDDLHISDDDHALWKGQILRIAWVPQRCWAYTGRLAVQNVLINGHPSLTSIEDTSSIRAKASPNAQAKRDTSLFVPLDALGNVPNKKDDKAPSSSSRFHSGQGREWRDKDDD